MTAGASASATLRALGLLVDGPVLWGKPVPSRSSGIFVIELAAVTAEAPIDIAAVTRWLERAPDLRLDGSLPTPHDLAAYLGRFWLPTEPVAYVGRSAKSLGARLAAIAATPLGDSRPNPAGHWLKTLLPAVQLRVWWAETDAHEEYEDALLAEIAGRQPAATLAGSPDPSVVLPFANLRTITGEDKRHGLSGSLREPTQNEARPLGGVSATSGPAAGVRRRPSPAAAARPRAARRSGTAAAQRATPPPPDPTYLSQAGVDKLAAELEHLRTNVRPGVIQRVKAARELGDLRENSEYESARREQSFVEGRIQALEALVRSAVVVESGAAGGTVGVGSTVVIELDGETLTWSVVGSSEADPARGRISYAAPVGQALLGRRAGDEAVARLPGGELRLRVLEVR
jgi:transcription elongation factor GreA